MALIDTNRIADNLQIPLANPTGSLQDLIARIIALLLYLAGVLAVLYLIYAGILYITSGGSPDQAKKAQAALISAIIGIIVISLSFVIFRIAINIAQGNL